MQNFKAITTPVEDARNKEIKIIFEGDLGLTNALQIQQTLREADSNYETAEIHGKDITSIDLSFIQIIEAYQKSMATIGKKVKIALDLSYDMKSLLFNAGIEYQSK